MSSRQPSLFSHTVFGVLIKAVLFLLSSKVLPLLSTSTPNQLPLPTNHNVGCCSHMALTGRFYPFLTDIITPPDTILNICLFHLASFTFHLSILINCFLQLKTFKPYGFKAVTPRLYFFLVLLYYNMLRLSSVLELYFSIVHSSTRWQSIVIAPRIASKKTKSELG